MRIVGRGHPDPVSLRPVTGTNLGTLGYLQTAERVSTQQAMDLLGSVVEEARDLPPLPVPPPARTDRGRLTPMEDLKERLCAPYEFIRRFVDPDEQGRGSCSFDPPDRHTSFAVDRRRRFWCCFHEVNPKTDRSVGGDVIAFYKRLSGLAYQEVLREPRQLG
jgi:hypothetical protein